MMDENLGKIPEHVAIILDGNGRWAKKRGLPRNMGHIQGARAVEDMCEIAWNEGIKYLTVYAFSTENWRRPPAEVKALMKLLREYMKNSIKRANANNMCVRVIGDKSGLDDDIRESIETLEESTRNNDGLHFQIAINYGGRDELRRCLKGICDRIANGTLKSEDITEDLISDNLDTAGLPDPDLLIRTCKEQRLSNFLPWQLTYAELYFTETAWPDFGKEELLKALDFYKNRERKFGGLKQDNG